MANRKRGSSARITDEEDKMETYTTEAAAAAGNGIVEMTAVGYSNDARLKAAASPAP
jgi:hypothetical protein